MLHVTQAAALQAYDQHLNMILGDVEETITSVEIDDETYEEIIKVRHASSRICAGRTFIYAL
jgi:small nuclear ribonucleoprotein (snRNP)-like protein